MAIPLDQIVLGADRPDIRDLVQAAMMNRCSIAFPATANADATIQAKRLELCRRVTQDPDRYVEQFTWHSLVTATVTALVDFDATVASNVNNQALWDRMADLLIDESEVTP